MKAMEYYRVNYDKQQFIHDKQYRNRKIKFVDDKNYLKMYNSQNHKHRTTFWDEN
jgi:hypothetical protein